jgi:hypothetical protein
MRADPWQREFLVCNTPRILLNCTRGAGKSRITGNKAYHHALFQNNALVLLVSRSQRQALELFNYVKDAHRAMGKAVRLLKETETQLRLENQSRIVCVPSREETIRSFQGVTLLIEDEAALIPEDLHRAIMPMIGVSKGQHIALTTPRGQRGWFHHLWKHDPNCKKFEIPWQKCPRYTQEFIAQERREHGESWVKQEYECNFQSLSGLVYSQFETCGIDFCGIRTGDPVGGMDFGFRDPFAAVWGHHDLETDVLTITGEHYYREETLAYHAANIPKHVAWNADPSQPGQIVELRRAGFTVRKAINAISAGIGAVRARIEAGKLKIVRHACPNLFAEAELYQYAEDSEKPIDDHNHALDALRYLVARIDRGFLKRYLGQGSRPGLLNVHQEENARNENDPFKNHEALNGPRSYEWLNEDAGWERVG